MRILAIESSCDETAAAVVEDGRNVLSSVVASQVEEHKLYGGVVPEIASRRHAEAIVGVVQEALDQARLTLGEVDAVAVTHAPGLIGALLVGVNFAKGLSMAAGLPLIPVHHLRSHIAANYLAHPELKPPFLCLVVSGGHSHIVAARAMGMPYPGGIHLDRIAEEGGDSAFAFPRPRVDGAEYDFSFSGLKTAVINQIHNASQKGVELPVADLAASFRKAVVDCLVQNFQKAAEDFHCTTLVTAGGVSANSLLRSRLEALCGERGWKLYMPPKELCGDNAAMVGAQGFYEWKAGNRAGLNLNACATMSIEG